MPWIDDGTHSTGDGPYSAKEWNTEMSLIIFEEIAAERTLQDAKWGEQNHADFPWLAILTEEVGEVAQAALHDVFGGSHAGTLRHELMQVAAVAVGWLECIDRRRE